MVMVMLSLTSATPASLAVLEGQKGWRKHAHAHTHTITHTHTDTLADQSSRGMLFVLGYICSFFLYHLLWPMLGITLHGIRWKQCTAKIVT